jgi:lipoprotein-releasing system permease protein
MTDKRRRTTPSSGRQDDWDDDFERRPQDDWRRDDYASPESFRRNHGPIDEKSDRGRPSNSVGHGDPFDDFNDEPRRPQYTEYISQRDADFDDDFEDEDPTQDTIESARARPFERRVPFDRDDDFQDDDFQDDDFQDDDFKDDRSQGLFDPDGFSIEERQPRRSDAYDRTRESGNQRASRSVADDRAFDPRGRDRGDFEISANNAAAITVASRRQKRKASAADGAFRALAPFSGPERLLAGRYLRARRQESFISVISVLSLIGIALGVATLIIVMSVMNGFRAELIDKIVGINGHLAVSSVFSAGIEDYDETADIIGDVPGVRMAAPLVQAQAFVSGPRNGIGALVRGMRQEDLLQIKGVGIQNEGIDAFPIGSLAVFNADMGVAIGSLMARTLGVSVGDKVEVLSPKGRATPFGVLPKRKSYPVTYIFQVGMHQHDSYVLYMPLAEAQTHFGRTTSQGMSIVDQIEVFVATPDTLETYRSDIRDALGQSVQIRDWKEANGILIGALKTERTVMFLILTLLILIASLIIISGLIMLVKEKTSDIAILRTMGLSRGSVVRVFFMCGATIGAVGTFFGVVLGVLITLNLKSIKEGIDYLFGYDVFPSKVYIFNELPARLMMEDVFLTVSIALGLSFLATLYPARKAAKLDPVEALRYE